MSVQKKLLLRRASGFTSSDNAMIAINAMFSENEMMDGEPFIAETTDGQVILGIKSSVSGSMFYNASTVDGLIEELNNKTGDLAELTTIDKSSLVAAINEVMNLAESDYDFESGVTLDAESNLVYGVVDPTSEEYLTVGEDGFKISGITAAIEAEAEARKNVTGVDDDVYSTHTEANYISAVTVTNLDSADIALDAAVKVNADAIAELEESYDCGRWAIELPNPFIVNGVKYYKTSDNTVSVQANDYSGDVVIPNDVYYYNVTAIESDAFEECYDLTSLVIGNNVTTPIAEYMFGDFGNLHTVVIGNNVPSIGDYAFGGCYSLSSITIPDSVTSIGDGAFSDCAGLSSITIPDSVASIGDNAFAYCYSLSSITIPDSVTSIGESAFDVCTSLNSITIPDSVTSIGNSAFGGCYSLSSITIPESVTSIGIGAFAGCSGMTSMVVSTSNTVYDSRGNCNAIIETDTNTLIAGCKNTVIPNTVTSIGNYAFSNCSSLSSITIPDSVTSIGQSAFLNCSGMTSVTIGSGVTSIGAYAFQGCSSLSSITIPDSVTSIGNQAFQNCTGLSSATIGSRVTSIGNNAFASCRSLSSITIPDSVTSIGDSTFASCYSLSSITIPDSVTSIGQYAFSYCSGMTSATIGSGVTSIGNNAFSSCYSLSSITIPDSVTSIGGTAFSNCSGMTSMTCLATTPPTLGANALQNTSSLTAIYVPSSYVNTYKSASGWSSYSSKIQAIQ